MMTGVENFCASCIFAGVGCTDNNRIFQCKNIKKNLWPKFSSSCTRKNQASHWESPLWFIQVVWPQLLMGLWDSTYRWERYRIKKNIGGDKPTLEVFWKYVKKNRIMFGCGRATGEILSDWIVSLNRNQIQTST